MTIPSALRCRIQGIGVWGPGFSNWSELRNCFQKKADFDEAQPSGPKPEVIPANERRRAPLPVKLAIETSSQASDHAGINPNQLNCVFSSGFGDIDITDYMCRTLNTETMQLSPTKFHNSVHNAPAGYWTISTNCMQSANSVAGFEVSTTVTILEAVAHLTTSGEPALLTFCDVPAKGPLIPVLVNQLPFSASIVLTPISEGDDLEDDAIDITLSVVAEPAEWPDLTMSSLQTLYQHNPSAKILCLLEALSNGDSNEILMPLSAETSLKLELGR